MAAKQSARQYGARPRARQTSRETATLRRDFNTRRGRSVTVSFPLRSSHPLGVRMHRLRILPLLAGAALTSLAITAEAQTLDSLTLAGFHWRTVGPANFEGRVADIAGIPSPSRTFFVAAAGGGIWK